MSEYRGKYSGSGKDPVPAKGSYCEDDAQDTGKQKQPKADRDYAGALSAPESHKGDKFLDNSATPSKSWK